MSCFEVGSTHIDALLTAGLSGRRSNEMTWIWPELSPEDEEGAYQRGEPWGPESVRLLQERRHKLTAESAGRVGAMLVAENRRSVDHRYNETETEDPYVFNSLPGQVNPLVVLKAIACYEYQACEHPEWHKSEAHAFCHSLRHKMIDILPGYDEADGWEVNSRNVFQSWVDKPKEEPEIPAEPEVPAIDTYDGKSIRAALKAETGYNCLQVSVRVEKYSMGHTVHFTIRNPAVDCSAVRRFAEQRVEHVDRCEMSGEILSGGNTYTEVSVTEDVTNAWALPYIQDILKAAKESLASGNGHGVKVGDHKDLWMFRDDFGHRVYIQDTEAAGQPRTFEVGTEGPSLVRLAAEVHLLVQRRGND